MIKGENTKRVFVDRTGGWITGREYFLDKDSATWLCEFFKGKSVSDFGCGADALYVQEMRKYGIEAYDYDSHEDTNKVPFCKRLNMVTDEPPPATDWVMCLEVLEHIPQDFEERALEMLDACNHDGLLISWARLGQGGTGHFNEKHPDAVIDTFTRRGYKYDEEASIEADKRCTNYRTLGGMKVFRRWK